MDKVALVTGGKGYLGSHVCKELKKQNWKVISLDAKGDYESHPYADYQFSFTDIRNRNKLNEIFEAFNIDTVFHFAGKIEVGESFKYPTWFWDVNVGGTSCLLNMMNQHNIKKIIFSSTAAVYEPMHLPIKEHWGLCSNSVYGDTKMACETMIRQSQMKYGIFRYFNLAGADIENDIGENHQPETHLIPQIFKNLNNFTINGNDYGTPDGTCIRDYVHVSDVAEIHVKAASYIDNESFTYNLGTGKGHSILEIIKLIEMNTGVKVNYQFGERRLGDPDILVADISNAQKFLGYQPKYDINDIIKTAYKWHLKQNKGETVV